MTLFIFYRAGDPSVGGRTETRGPESIRDDALPTSSPEDFRWEGRTRAARCYLWYTRKIPGHPAKHRIARRLARWLFPDGLALVNSQGARLSLDASRPDFIPHRIVYEGEWEPGSLALASRLMDRGGTFLDIGSHVGLYACTVGTLEGVRCICIEPSPAAFLQLRKNLSLNPRVKATLVHAALSASAGTQKFGETSRDNTGTARILRAGEESPDQYLTACVTLEEVLERIGAAGGIELMKIDVEGHEMEVYRGLDWSGPYRPQNIIAEFEPSLLRRAGVSAEECLAFFDERGYEALTVEGRKLDHAGPPPEDNIWLRSRCRS